MNARLDPAREREPCSGARRFQRRGPSRGFSRAHRAERRGPSRGFSRAHRAERRGPSRGARSSSPRRIVTGGDGARSAIDRFRSGRIRGRRPASPEWSPLGGVGPGRVGMPVARRGVGGSRSESSSPWPTAGGGPLSNGALSRRPRRSRPSSVAADGRRSWSGGAGRAHGRGFGPCRSPTGGPALGVRRPARSDTGTAPAPRRATAAAPGWSRRCGNTAGGARSQSCSLCPPIPTVLLRTGAQKRATARLPEESRVNARLGPARERAAVWGARRFQRRGPSRGLSRAHRADRRPSHEASRGNAVPGTLRACSRVGRVPKEWRAYRKSGADARGVARERATRPGP